MAADIVAKIIAQGMAAEALAGAPPYRCVICDDVLRNPRLACLHGHTFCASRQGSTSAKAAADAAMRARVMREMAKGIIAQGMAAEALAVIPLPSLVRALLCLLPPPHTTFFIAPATSPQPRQSRAAVAAEPSRAAVEPQPLPQPNRSRPSRSRAEPLGRKL